MSFLDAFFKKYNQIRLAPEDQEKTSFVKEQGTYCCTAMPFGLKNAGATYQRGIEANLEKIEAIIKMQSPNTVKEVQKLAGMIAALNRFISRSSDKGLLFFKVLITIERFSWTEQCQAAFEDLKKYLASPPLLTKPKPDETLFLYLAVSKGAVSAVLVREGCKHQSIYYVSKTLQVPKEIYPQIEKMTLALVTAARRLSPYFQSHP
ncbi:UNVERIFIED_CONTAM: hypothetical protein Sradi_2318500 [Sesamum radiatum]|uniref:Reverse transcriptase/retrotransposon-derived protein RNase H-like domain-containing protein n=1 Tax=Sesamum radiatum TaxID=300843 RepID=A0AAW2T556_SESRA